MKVLFAILAAGTAYYYTSRVYITGLADWGVLQESAAYENDYAIRASLSPLVGVTIQGDPEFTIDGSTCPGVQSCTAPVFFAADVGGDYSATIIGTSTSVCCRTRGSSATKTITAHVVGANYALTGYDSGGGTGTFTLSSTGETDLLNATFAVSTYNDAGPPISVTSNTCGEDIPPGESCQVVVTVGPLPPEWAGGYVYLLVTTTWQ